MKKLSSSAFLLLGLAACGGVPEAERALSQSQPVIGAGDNALSLETPVSATNGWGPFERDRSNGEMGAADGRVLTLNGQTYARGFGVHSHSELAFRIDGKCAGFTADVGVDDEVGTSGSVVFQVFADGVKLFDSGTLTGASPTKSVNVSLAGKNLLKLVVTNAGDGTTFDHADWANPVLRNCTAAIPYGGPIVITQGGTYTGNWESQDATIPAVQVKTSEPVILENANIRSRSTLITANFVRAHLTVRDVRATALNPNNTTKHPGRFLTAEEFNHLVVENNELTGTSGIYLRAWLGNPATDTVRILRNRVRNIDGRYSNGSNGYRNDFYRVQFVQFNAVRHIPNVEIAWNEVINEPFQSRVEDNINFHVSSGTAQSPIRVHDNFIQGGYDADPINAGYSGGGILLCDGSSPTVADACGYVQAFRNVVVSTVNYGIAISAGHDNIAYENRVVSSGRMPDGRIPKAQNVGMYVWDLHGDSSKYNPPTFFNNVIRDNQVVWTKVDPVTGNTSNNPWWIPHCAAGACPNQALPSPFTLEGEKAEHSAWLARVAQQGITVGVH
jgi:hypothetical protein